MKQNTNTRITYKVWIFVFLFTSSASLKDMEGRTYQHYFCSNTSTKLSFILDLRRCKSTDLAA